MARTLLLALLLLGAACVDAPKVLQGTVTSYDAATRRMVVVDELPPGEEVEISVETAEIGAEPSPGDVVRVAYHDEDHVLIATRVMNITRQADMKGSGGH